MDWICINTRFTDEWFSEFQLPDFQNGLQFNSQFCTRYDFGLDMFYYPLQQRLRFCLRLLMCAHMRLTVSPPAFFSDCGIADIQVSNLKATHLRDYDTLHPQKYTVQDVYIYKSRKENTLMHISKSLSSK